ncbi:MAG: hypothetical protein QME51_08280, partial [Planctomycetota bacterium]|nr:hypothetical protein [Planctomycetota bacterium]
LTILWLSYQDVCNFLDSLVEHLNQIRPRLWYILDYLQEPAFLQSNPFATPSFIVSLITLYALRFITSHNYHSRTRFTLMAPWRQNVSYLPDGRQVASE